MPSEEENVDNSPSEVKSSDTKKSSEAKNVKDEGEDTQPNKEPENNKENKAHGKNEETSKQPVKKEESVKNSKEENESEKEEEEEEEEEDNQEDDNDTEKKSVPLLDQPLEVSGTRERKKVSRFNEEFNEAKEVTKLEIPEGKGTPLGEIPRIDASISRFKNDDLKILHRLLYKCQGKTTQTKSNIKKFHGFDFKKDTEEYKKKIAWAVKFDLKQLKSICEMLDLEKKGTKDEICERIINFLLEPQDYGKVPGGGRPRRSAAVKASNRGYSSHDSGSADERHSSRNKRGKGKRTNLKDDSSSGSDEDFQPSDDGDDEDVKVSSRSSKRGSAKKSSSDEASDISATSLEDSDVSEPKKRKKVKKVANSGSMKKRTPMKRGRPPLDKKKTAAANQKQTEDDSDADTKTNDASSSEDEPLIKKKTKSTHPPTDEEIKTCVKEILDGANLEEITMKTVCKQVYANYPNFDLSHKKDFIKSTVKSLIST